MEQEKWVEMWDYPKYEISNLGNVRNAKTEKKLSIRIDGNGYRVVSLWENKVHTKRVGRYVWMSFNNQFCRATVDHIDDNRTNDNLDNLQCISMMENIKKRKPIIKGNKYNISDENKKQFQEDFLKGLISSWDIHKRTKAPLNYIKQSLKRGTWNKYLSKENNEL